MLRGAHSRAAPKSPGATVPENTSPALNRLQIARGLRISIWEGSFATVFSMLTFNSVFLTGFALLLGANDTQIGLLASVSAISTLSQILCPYFGPRAPSRRWLMIVTAYPGRMLWIPILLLPFLHLPRGSSIWILIGLFGLSMALMNFPTPAWTTWMADLVPADVRGRYFSRRNMIMGFAGMAALLGSGFYKDAVSRRHDPESQVISFALVFGVAVMFAIGGWIAMSAQPEPAARRDRPVAPADFIRLPLRDAGFRRLTLYFLLWVVAVNIPAPYFAVYMIRNLKLSYGEMNSLAVMTQIGGLAALPFWGYLSDKYGNKPVIALCSAVIVLLPWAWLFATPHNAMLILSCNNLVGGMAWYGLNLAQFNLVIAVTPQDRKQLYIAAVSVISGVGSFAGPLIGAGLLSVLASYHLSLFRMALVPMEALFVLSSLGRILAALFGLPRVNESESQPAGYMLHQLTRSDPLRTFIHLRRARQVINPARRADSIRELGSLGAALAVDELIPALQDPSPGVRREAARALGKIRDPKAVPFLGEALRSPALGIGPEAARALASIGSEEAIPLLVDALEDESRMVRVEALRGLGEMDAMEAAPDAINALTRARDENAVEVVEAACEALGRIGSGPPGAEGMLDNACEALQAALTDNDPRARAAAARALGALSVRTVNATAIGREIAQALDRETVEVNVGTMADALAGIGALEYLGTLWKALHREKSPVLRRQIAHALAMLLAPGPDAYALIAPSGEAREERLIRFLNHHFGAASRSRTDQKSQIDPKAHGNDPEDQASAEDVLEALQRRDFRVVLTWCLDWISPLERSPVARLLRMMAQLPPEQISEEDSLIALLAAARLQKDEGRRTEDGGR